jgi:lipopolysaccharide/colanic/teichoic acid biosynthesis glycosyltransferase
MTKRIFDIVVASLALVLLSPIMLVIAVLVKLDSKGPFLFSQERIGLDGRPFRLHKFRSMTYAPLPVHPNVSAEGDLRVTRVGAFLRKRFLDELPQLTNVLKGEMSMVGPRPETPEYVALYSAEQRRVLTVKPGMAGPSAVAFFNEAEILANYDDPYAFYLDHLLHERVRLDLGYIDRASLRGDVALLVRAARLALTGAPTPVPGIEVQASG